VLPCRDEWTRKQVQIRRTKRGSCAPVTIDLVPQLLWHDDAVLTVSSRATSLAGPDVANATSQKDW
jgi:hypothetical protein